MVAISNYQFHYCLRGNKNKPVILFLHGFMGSSDDFGEIMTLLSDQFYCLAVDLPGHGQTQVLGSEECYTMANTAQALIDLLDQLNIKKCFLVGYSMGGRLALYLALHFPHRFAKVVLESATFGLKTQKEQQLRIAHDAGTAKALETKPFKPFLLAWYNHPTFGKITQHLKFEELLERRLKNNPLELAKSLRFMGTGCQPYLGEKLVNNHIPMLLLVGQQDSKFIAINAEMAEKCKTAILIVIENCSHNIHFEQMYTWFRYVKDFLST